MMIDKSNQVCQVPYFIIPVGGDADYRHLTSEPVESISLITI